MATLQSLLEVPGVVAAWRWQPGSTQPGQLAGPRLIECCGSVSPEVAEVGMLYLETLGHLLFFQCSLLDHKLKRQVFLPAQSLVVEAKEFTGVATANRVAVLVDNARRPPFWELEEKMLAVEGSE